MYPNNELFWYLHQMVILMFIFRVVHQNITLVIIKTVRHASNYIFRYIFMGCKKKQVRANGPSELLLRISSEYIRCFTWYNGPINDLKNDDLHTSAQCLTCLVGDIDGVRNYVSLTSPVQICYMQECQRGKRFPRSTTWTSQLLCHIELLILRLELDAFR